MRLPSTAVVLTIAVLATTAWSGDGRTGYRSASVEIEHELRVPNPSARSGSCGVERWSVKTGMDADAQQVDLGTPSKQTIEYLLSLRAPAGQPPGARRHPAETTLYQIDATLVGYQMQGDSDYRMVIRDPQGHTMFAEIPDPACVTVVSPFAQGIRKARDAFDARFSASSRYKAAHVAVRVTGVGFFDARNGLAGVAPNAIELHPVLDVVFNPEQGATGR